MKTIRQWYEDELPADIAALAIANAEDQDAERLTRSVETLSYAICSGFFWSSSPQGWDFWIQVHNGDYGDTPTLVSVEIACDHMEARGGSFAKSLAECWRSADPRNRRKLEQAFRDVFQKYRGADG